MRNPILLSVILLVTGLGCGHEEVSGTWGGQAYAEAQKAACPDGWIRRSHSFGNGCWCTKDAEADIGCFGTDLGAQ